MGSVTTALLVGGGGFIGAHLARVLADAHVQVTVADAGIDYSGPDAGRDERAWRDSVLLSGVEYARLHTSESGELGELIAATRPDAVVHLANLPLPSAAARAPGGAHEQIVGSTEALISALEAAAPACRLVYVSSSMVYGHFVADPQPESAPLQPLGEYGEKKLHAEQLVLTRRPDSVIVRPSAVYGPGDGNRRLLQRLVDSAIGGPELLLTATPDTAMDFTWVEDLARGLAAAATSPGAAGAYNVTAGHAHTIADAIETITALGHAPNVVLGPVEPGRPVRGSLSIARARADLGYAPQVSLREGLERYVAHRSSLAATLR